MRKVNTESNVEIIKQAKEMLKEGKSQRWKMTKSQNIIKIMIQGVAKKEGEEAGFLKNL